MDGNGRPYFSNAIEKEGKASSPMRIRFGSRTGKVKVVICRGSRRVALPVMFNSHIAWTTR
jgi:hypothetical protein